MFKKMSVNIINELVEKGKLEGEKFDDYVYAMTGRLERTLFDILALLLSIPFGAVGGAILFLLALRLLREHTGGYHAKGAWTCLAISVSIVVLGFIVLPYAATLHYGWIVSVSLASGAVVWRFAPVNHPAYCGSVAEMAAHKLKARKHTVAIVCCIVLLGFLPISALYGVYVGYALLVTAVLIILAKLIRQEMEALKL